MTQTKITVIIPTYNEDKNIGRCLDSIVSQDFPEGELEIIVIDDCSTDKTQEVVKKYPVRLVVKNQDITPRGAEPSKILGYSLAKGEYFIYLEADSYLSSAKYFSILLAPMLAYKQVAGSFSRCLPDLKYDAPINRYLSYHELHYDPMVEFFGCSIKEIIVNKCAGFDLCLFKPERLPPVGCCLYRMKDLKNIISDPHSFTWVDTEIPLLLMEQGKNQFAYISDVGYYHLSVKNLKDLLKQKRRDITKTFLPGLGQRKVTYIDLKSVKDMLRVFFWIIYANLIIPSLLKAVYKIIKHKDWACIYEVPATLFVTDYILYLFLKESRGRKIISDFIRDKLR